MTPYTDTLRRMTRTASWSLYGSMGVAIAVMVFYYASPYAFTLSPIVARYMFYGATALAVLVIAMALLTVRRKPRLIRQIDDLQQRLNEYSAMVRSLFSTAFTTNAVLCLVILLTHNNTLLMFVIIMVLLLFLSYPNMYKVKADAGLTHEQMREVYGEQYTAVEGDSALPTPAENENESHDD